MTTYWPPPDERVHSSFAEIEKRSVNTYKNESIFMDYNGV